MSRSRSNAEPPDHLFSEEVTTSSPVEDTDHSLLTPVLDKLNLGTTSASSSAENQNSHDVICGEVDSTQTDANSSFSAENSTSDEATDKIVALQTDAQTEINEEPSEEDISYRHRQLSKMVLEQEEVEEIDLVSCEERKRHIFVLTQAGKPVYSRHGNEEKWTAIMGVILAIVSCVQDRNDRIKNIIAGEHKIVFLVKPHLILVAVCTSPESAQQVELYLEYVYSSIISVLTTSQLERIYSKQKNFDLRRLLTGMDKFFDHLCRSMDSDPQYLLGALHCLPLPGQVRDMVSQALQQAKTDDLAFAVLISSGRVVSTCRLKEHQLHTKDLQIILNFITTSTSFDAGETWLPICLPQFNPSGFLHGHISYVDEQLQTCLVLLSADRDAFFNLSECKEKVVSRLVKHGCLKSLRKSLAHNFYTVEKIGIPDLRHFLYKAKHLSQFTCPEFSTPYDTDVKRWRLVGRYQELHGKIHNGDAPLKLLYSVSGEETVLAWMASGFELYAAFSPLVSKNEAIAAVDHLLRWLKLHEDELFMLRPVTF